MIGADERVWRPSEILQRYKQGERNFQELDISDDLSNENSSFRDAILEDADFSRSFVVADFSNARLRNSRFVEGNVKTCKFDGADLRNADFSRTAIDSATFATCDFEGAQFDGAGSYGYTFKKGELPI